MKYVVWMNLGIERFTDEDHKNGDDPSESIDAMPDRIGTFNSLKKAKAFARELVERHGEDPENSDWVMG